MILEAALPKDAAAMAAVHAASFAEPWDARAIAEVLASPGAFGLLVREPEDGAALGFALGRTMADEAELLTLAVAPPARRKGLARALVSALAAAAETAGATSLFLEVAHDNTPALALYAALGFQQMARRPGYYSRADGPADALVLRRDLNSARP
jgi:ribosomal-protein-alanine N-acetyltransferase